jgi:hypothetical protein
MDWLEMYSETEKKMAKRKMINEFGEI